MGALGVAAVTLTAFWLRRRWTPLLAAWAAFALTRLPVLGIGHNGYQAAADRSAYLAAFGLAVLAGAAVAGWRRGALWPAALGFASLLALTWLKEPVWRSNLTLWRRAVEVDPDSGVARSNLGAALTGQHPCTEATRELEEAMAHRPGYAEAWNNLGPAPARQGRVREAAEEFRRALCVNPEFLEARRNLEQAERFLGR